MAPNFTDIPEIVVAYIRKIFAGANNKVTRTVTIHPSMHEPTLDHILIMELTASPPTFFAQVQMGVLIESHWLGERWMFGHWEIADIGFVVMLRHRGRLIARKVALLQTKHLHSNEIAVTELHEDDYQIGIGRLVDRTDPQLTIATQRAFSFDGNCKYKALQAGDEQVARIKAYIRTKEIPVYYGLYNPLTVPCSMLYPVANGSVTQRNSQGLRVVPFASVKEALDMLKKGQAPSFNIIVAKERGWRLEHFIADEVLNCREGHVFRGTRTDPRLHELLYARGSLIIALISITVDFGVTE